MKSIGVVRHVDPLGRIVIPVETRKILDISVGDQMEIYTDGDAIILEKYKTNCIFCGSSEIFLSYKNQLVCKDCVKHLHEFKKIKE